MERLRDTLFTTGRQFYRQQSPNKQTDEGGKRGVNRQGLITGRRTDQSRDIDHHHNKVSSNLISGLGAINEDLQGQALLS